VGFLSAASSDGFAYLAVAFRQGLQESGFVVGQNLEIEYRWGDGDTERLPALATDLVQRQVSAIVGGGGAAGAACLTAAKEIVVEVK
jgi:putative tryptophan/tyrosine transport system substrate-binding protein